MKSLYLLVSLVSIVLSTGCAHQKTYVVARHNPQRTVSIESRIAVSPPANDKSQNVSVYQAALAELAAAGFRIVPPAEAEYTLLVLVDKHARAVAGSPSPMTQVSPYMVISGSDGSTSRTPLYRGPFPTPTKEYSVSEGIRLSLYPARADNAAQIQPVWDGFVDSGHLRLSPEQHRPMIRLLLRYFGQDFAGEVQPIE